MNTDALFACATLLLAAGLGLLGLSLLGRARQQERSSSAIEHALNARLAGTAHRVPLDTRLSWWRRSLAWIASIGRLADGSSLGRALLAPEDCLLLDQANWNTVGGRSVFLGMRVLLALLLPVLAMLWLQPHGLRAVVAMLGALALGVLAPKFALRAWAERLRKRTDDELPLLIDLLRLLQGVGFSVDQSLQMIADRFHAVLPLLGKEILDANTAYMHGRPRDQSLRRLAEAYANDDLQSLVQMILQVHQHGGAVQEPLRQFGVRLREQRKMRMKEQTGKLSVKMTLVMMLTLLPALMLVLAGPAVIALADAVLKMKGP